MIFQMRFLFSFAGGTGHYLPTEHFARAVVKLGHQVRYSCQEKMVDLVAADGWEVVPSGGPSLLSPDQRLPLVAVDRAHEQRVASQFASKKAAERARGLAQVISDWRPDIVVHDEMDYGAAVAAEQMGLPHADVCVLASGGIICPEVVVEALSPVCAAHGLRAEPGEIMAMLERYLTLAPFPPSFRDPAHPLPSRTHHVRPAVLDAMSPPKDLRGRPGVYFSLGTIFHQESGDLFARALAGLRSLPVDVLVTVGREVSPDELGEQPPNVRVEHFVPLAEALAASEVVVCHGGSGTVVGALAYGLPLVLLPLGADQPWNADRCTELGLAVVLDPLACTSEDVATATTKVLGTPSYAERAQLVREECLSLPGAEEAASWLEELAS